MAVREIITLPNPTLRRKAHKITAIDKDLQGLIDDMIETLRSAPGVGLAAPQVDQSIRLIVVEYAEEDDDGNPIGRKKLYILINPEIIEASEEKAVAIEACLSIPGYVGEVERHERIVIRAQNNRGKNIKIKANGWLARIFQHEIDHLDGIVYPDRASRVWIPKPEENIVVAD